MNSTEVRRRFLEYFKSKGHRIVDSAPMVNKNDPTLMFTNAGMNQFKDAFLGNSEPVAKRVADTQKCLRVSGKHNDLEEVGIDSYHHTMFEMLGNWSFGDYFKRDAIDYAWELLTQVYDLPKDRLYVTVFGGDKDDGLDEDTEARGYWEDHLPQERILSFGKKDNFWEMGDTGPCGPCSEIHIDMRTEEERSAVPGSTLVNTDNPLVIELWNLVFIQFDRKADSSLGSLPQKHVDTGMGFERLCMVIQGKKANYDSDVFTPMIQYIERATGITYTGDFSGNHKSDVAMRVVADHVRALFFGIIDGQLPSNTGAGYVLRRILRRAVRYYFSFLDTDEPLLHQLVPSLVEYFDGVFPGVKSQGEFAARVILEEEKSFLRTLELGLKRLDKVMVDDGIIDGEEAFELYDTYGFPIDLTRLIGQEKGLEVDEEGFKKALSAQKQRSRADAKKAFGDWHIVSSGEPQFVGYDQLKVSGVRILRYREVEAKGKSRFQLVLDQTPFYPEGGGQVGDVGKLIGVEGEVRVVNSLKENDLPLIIIEKLPEGINGPFDAVVLERKRHLTENNHTATHLLHAALRSVLGDHVHQKGSLVNEKHLRFDFSHFSKMTADELREVETIVNEKIRDNIRLQEDRSIPIEEAQAAGAMMLFGEKYGDHVRMITFDPAYSVELCGGCHVDATGQIGTFKIVSETAVAAGVRRVEAITADSANKYINDKLDVLHGVEELVKHPKNLEKSISGLIEENKALRKELEGLKHQAVIGIRKTLEQGLEDVGSIKYLATKLDGIDSTGAKDLVYQLTDKFDSVFVVLGIEIDGKAQLHVGISKDIAGKDGMHAGEIIRKLSRHIKGGGGGQPFYASAGGKDPDGISAAIAESREIVANTDK